MDEWMGGKRMNEEKEEWMNGWNGDGRERRDWWCMDK